MKLKDPNEPDSVVNLKNFGERSSRLLHAIGVTTISEVRALGSVEVFARMRRAGLNVSTVVLWALEMGLQGRTYTDITEREKKTLISELRLIDPTFRRR
ncbi:MAG: TfoX/Sxy family protein [Bacteroidetes bacterium]|nr:TfoX/Sxy family protein [Bacteroidota bacterium]